MKFIVLLLPILFLVSCTTSPKPSLEASAPGSFLRHGDITLDLKTDKPIYKEGEAVTITLTTSQKANVRIFNEDAEGNRSQLWPNPHTGSSEIVSPGTPLIIPTKGSSFVLRASKPYGVNTIVAVAASSPFLNTVTSDDFFVDRSMQDFAQKGIIWSAASVTGISATNRGEARYLYEVKHP